MYFYDEEHNKNYTSLMSLYGLLPEEDGYYEASIYIASFQDIFKCIDLKKVDKSKSPLFELMKFDDKENILIPIHPALTGTTTQLVRWGINIYTSGYPLDINNLFSQLANDRLLRVVIQSIKIRRMQPEMEL